MGGPFNPPPGRGGAGDSTWTDWYEMVMCEAKGRTSDPQGEADTEGIPPLDPAGDAVSPEEDAFLMQPASQSEDPTAGSHSPRSETGMVSGEMADLSLTSPSQPGPGEDETQQ